MVHFASEREIRSEATNLFEKIIKFAKSKLRKLQKKTDIESASRL